MARGTCKHHCRALEVLEGLDLEHRAQKKGSRVSALEVASARGPADGELHVLKLASSSGRQAPRCQEIATGLEETHTNYTLKKGGWGALPETQMLFLTGLFVRQSSAEMLDS